VWRCSKFHCRSVREPVRSSDRHMLVLTIFIGMIHSILVTQGRKRQRKTKQALKNTPHVNKKKEPHFVTGYHRSPSPQRKLSVGIRRIAGSTWNRLLMRVDIATGKQHWARQRPKLQRRSGVPVAPLINTYLICLFSVFYFSHTFPFPQRAQFCCEHHHTYLSSITASISIAFVWFPRTSVALLPAFRSLLFDFHAPQ
jgi:hypothetical protein